MVYNVAPTFKFTYGLLKRIDRTIDTEQLNAFLEKGWEITHMMPFGGDNTALILVVLEKPDE